VTLTFGPWGSTQALYYTSYANGGEVRRIGYGSNRAPVATASASPRSGPVPLTVQLNASGSSDADGDPMTFVWNAGDGTTPRAGAVLSHTYVTAGRYTAIVTVSDNRGGSSTASVVIDAGNRPPAPTISSPSSTATFSVGQVVTLTGSALDPEEGALPASSLLWAVLIHHDTHTHPYMPPTVGNNITFQAPPPEDLAATTNSYLEIILTATDSHGASTTVRRNMQPRTVSVTLDASPSGATLQVNGTAVTTPRVLTSWVGYQLMLSASTQRDSVGQAWLFSSWSDGGAASHTVVTPAIATRYTATFTAAATAIAAADTTVRNGSFAAQNFGSDTSLIVKHSETPDNQRRTFVRFTIGAIPVGRAVLRLRGALSGAGDVSVAARPVASTAWSESTVTWGSQPPIGAATLATTRITTTAVGWYEWDVTNYVRGERAAGRTAVALALTAPSATSPYAFFASREAANKPELLIAQDAAGTSDIVLYGGDASAVTGTWRTVNDTTAAGGLRVHNPDAGVPKLTAPSANPAGYVEFTFSADAGRPYRLWMRGRADRNGYVNDSVFVQFSNSVTSTGTPAYRIGTTSATTYVLEDCSGCVLSGWGWQDNGYGTGVLGPPIYFSTSGTQVMRLQNREDGLSIDQVVLSPQTYITQRPGAATNDTTIVPKP
jgi:PKD repeat protein